MSKSPPIPDYWYSRQPPPWHARALAALYAQVVSLRLGLYRVGLLRRRTSPVPVIVVGNVTVGGTGKTPLTIALVKQLLAAGHSPGVASRGYGRGTKDAALWVEATTTTQQAGDEPVLIARETGVPVRVDRDRARAAAELAARGCDVVVCDDGLQHYRLARDIEIEVIDGQRRYGNGRLLPAGPLREPATRGGQCDFRVLNGGEAGFGEWPMRLQSGDARPMRGGRPRALASFAGQRVHAVAGIGNPDRFFGMLKGLGIGVVPHAFPDHHQYRGEDFEFASELPVLMTEKDAVKCAAFASDHFYSVPVEARLPEAFWVALLDRLDKVKGHPDGA